MAMKKETSELITGIFVLAGVAALVAVAMWVGAQDLIPPEGRDVSFFASQSAGALGLEAGAEIFYGDVRIGALTEVVPHPGQGCLYRGKISDERIVLRSDADVEVTGSLIGQTKLVVKAPGSDDSADAGDSSPITLQLTGIPLVLSKAATELDPDRPASLIGKIHSITDDLKTTTGLIASPFGRAQMAALVLKLSTAANDLSVASSSLRKAVDPSDPKSVLGKASLGAEHFRQAAERIDIQTDPAQKDSVMASVKRTVAIAEKVVGDAAPVVERSLASMEKAVADLRDANTLIMKASAGLAAFAETSAESIAITSPKIDRIVADVSRAAKDMRTAMKDIKWHPWKLVHMPSDSEKRELTVADSASSFSEGAASLNEALEALNRLKDRRGAALTADDPQLKEIRKKLTQSYSQFKKVEDALWEKLAE